MTYAKLLSPEAVEKLTADMTLEQRALVTINPSGSDDFPHFAHETRDFTKRTALLEAQNHRCAYCGVLLKQTGRHDADDFATIDHFVPRAARGLAIWSNEIMACWKCNTGRGAMFAMRYFHKVQEVGRDLAYHWGRREQSRANKRNIVMLY